ncbi:MAG TPA: hypothetical protein DC060_15850 [Gemmatimonadetes bacterium]|nr:hypothetical protein [Gemmatimonadota bacterium]
MPQPFASIVSLSDLQSEELESLLRAGSTPQALAFRVRIVLRAGETDEPSNVRIAGELGCARNTVAKWRERYVDDGLLGLQDAPRSGRPPVFSPRCTGFGRFAGDQPARGA